MFEIKIFSLLFHSASRTFFKYIYNGTLILSLSMILIVKRLCTNKILAKEIS